MELILCVAHQGKSLKHTESSGEQFSTHIRGKKNYFFWNFLSGRVDVWITCFLPNMHKNLGTSLDVLYISPTLNFFFVQTLQARGHA